MMRKTTCVVGAFLFIVFSASAALGTHNSAGPFQLYKPNYMIFGDGEDQVKGLFSFQYALFHPSRSGLYFGYSQLMFWDLYKQSGPFRELIYNPELFWCRRFECQLPSRIQIGLYEHLSNGRDGADSRRWDRGYARIDFTFETPLRVICYMKGHFSYGKGDENRDITRYVGNGEAGLSIARHLSEEGKSRERICFRGGFSRAGGWMEAEAKVRLVSLRFQPCLFLQMYNGYAETMIDYREKNRAFRAGLILE